MLFSWYRPQRERARTEIRYSGDDYHFVSVSTAPDGTTIVRADLILKDSTMYGRESLPDNPDAYSDWSVVGEGMSGAMPLPCIDPSSYESGARSSESDEPHYVTSMFLSEEEGSMQEEFWADATGRPVRSRRTFYPPDAVVDEASGTSAEDVALGVIHFTYSGYGDPNVITAPTLPRRHDWEGPATRGEQAARLRGFRPAANLSSTESGQSVEQGVCYDHDDCRR